MLHHPEVKVEALLDAARARFTLPPTSPHGAGHWMRVLKYGRVFARELHGHRAADWVAQHNGELFSFDRQRMRTLQEMMRQHNEGGYVPSDPTAAAFVSGDRSDIDREGVNLNVSSKYFTPEAWRVYVDRIMPLKKLSAVAA